MYAWPDYCGYDPTVLQQYGYGIPPDPAALQWGGWRWWVFPFLFWWPFFFRRWWW
ncbi:MAG: hypothetical protein NUV93_01015 [Firmicutes bacterium]|jgi:hypothetical protein|nr:hypothetical protein [Bacillota bacterium]